MKHDPIRLHPLACPCPLCAPRVIDMRAAARTAALIALPAATLFLGAMAILPN